MSLEEIQVAVSKLSPVELAQFCAWFDEFDAGNPDKLADAKGAEPQTGRED